MKKILNIIIVILVVLFYAMILTSCEKDLIDDIDDIVENTTEILVHTHEIQPPNSVTTRNLEATINWSQANLYYSIGDIEYLLVPGGGTQSKTHPILFKKQNNKWNIHKVFTNVEMEGIRQGYKIDESTFIMSDAAECYSDECKTKHGGIVRPGNFIWLIKVNGDDLSFERIGDETFHHDVTYGDLDLDGDMDIISTDGRIYYQTPSGWEKDVNWQNTNHGTVFFAIEILDLDGGYPEIIQASYLNSIRWKHGFRILKRNDDGYYEEVHSITESLINSYGGEYGASKLESIDINYDGIKDLIIEREGTGISGRTVEIYFGNGGYNFIPNQLITNNGNTPWTKHDLLDINNDGFLDIVFSASGFGSGLRLGNTFEEGFQLQNLIYINDGFGSFNKINKELISRSSATLYKFVPHLDKENNLTFQGGLVENNKLYFSEVIIKNL